MCKVSMDIITNGLTGNVVCVAECGKDLSHVSLVTNTVENIKFYAKEILPANCKFHVALVAQDKDEVYVRRYVGRVVGNHILCKVNKVAEYVV